MNGNIPDTFWTIQEELSLFGGACLLGIPAGILFDMNRLFRRMKSSIVPNSGLTAR